MDLEKELNKIKDDLEQVNNNLKTVNNNIYVITILAIIILAKLFDLF